MTKQKPCFFQAFPLAKITAANKELFTKTTVENVEIERSSRSLYISLSFPSPVTDSSILKEAERSLKEAYSLNDAYIIRYASGVFTEDYIDDAIDFLRRKKSIINGFFSKYTARFEGNKLIFTLALDSLPVETKEVEAIISKYVSLSSESRYSVEIEFSGSSDVKVFDDQIAEEIKTALSELPVSQPTATVTTPQKKSFVKRNYGPKTRYSTDAIFGKPFGDDLIPIKEIDSTKTFAAIEGTIFNVSTKEIMNGSMISLVVGVTDKTSSVYLTRKFKVGNDDNIVSQFKVGTYIYAKGNVYYDRFIKDLVIGFTAVLRGDPHGRFDNAKEKRVELHMHTQMSAMDAVSSVTDLIKQAHDWGHPAVAVTDHGVAQAYPDAAKSAKSLGYKVIYGCEGYYVNNFDDIPIVVGEKNEPLNGYFVCFDIETTGTNPVTDKIIQIGASLVHDGVVIDNFSTFVNPERHIPDYITSLTGISNSMVADAPGCEEACKAFLDFVGDRVVVAHNASFDTSFVYNVCKQYGYTWNFTSVDTLGMSRVLLPKLEHHKLNNVVDALKLPKFKHHLADEDTKALCGIFIKLIKMASAEFNITQLSELDPKLNERRRIDSENRNFAKSLPVRHILMLVKNKTGLKNLYKLISAGHLYHMNSRKQPVIPRNLLVRHREGLIIGSACSSGELYSAILDGKSWDELVKIANFYDFLEVQPLGNNEYLIDENTVPNREKLIEYNKLIIKLGDRLKKPVCATCDVHFKDPEDEVFRRILQAGKGFADADKQAPLYFRTTDEMLAEFSYLSRDKAYEIVVKNTNLIAEMCENIKPLPSEMFAPVLENSAADLERIITTKAREIYGDDFPPQVRERIDKEMNCIISNNYDVMYMTAQKLIKGSNDRGYIVGSRGSVGSSIVAFLAGISEVNSLPAHYVCPSCHHTDFDTPPNTVGPDLPDKLCPVCGAEYVKHGFNIPFETFLGFNGDKVPDIDLNFSGEDQANAHAHTIELFGKENVFRAGTIGTIADKTAYGYIKKYLDERGISVSKAEEDRLVIGCTGVKRTTGQHPGGMIVVPRTKEIYDFCAIQHPADDSSSEIITTHIDYHTMESNLLKFDILGHDDPTMLRMMSDLTGIKVDEIPLGDKDTMSLYSTNEKLHIRSDDIIGTTGAVAIPEFGTKFVRQMLVDTQPDSMAELVKVAGLSHGTNVWLGNAADLISSGTTDINGTITCRDDIMLYLMSQGMDPKLSCAIMESVRKGRKLKPEWEPIMREHNVPEWYIESCNKIGYLYPKAHAVAYAVSGFRIAYFKMHYPLVFYAAYFTIRAAALDSEVMLSGDDNLVRIINETAVNKDAAAIDQDLAKTYEVVHEFILRGFEFLPCNLEKSYATKFMPEDGKLRMPFAAIKGLGESAAKSIVEERSKSPFLSIDEMISRCKVSRTIAEEMKRLGVLKGLPDSEQMSFM